MLTDEGAEKQSWDCMDIAQLTGLRIRVRPGFPVRSVQGSPLKPTVYSRILFHLSSPCSLLPPSPFYCTAWGSELSTSVKLPPRISQGILMYMFDLEAGEILLTVTQSIIFYLAKFILTELLLDLTEPTSLSTRATV